MTLSPAKPFDINNAPFIGKFSFSIKDDKNCICILCLNEKGGLSIEAGDPNKPAPGHLFNLYGSLENGFVMQAPNFSYIWLDTNGYYRAEKVRTDVACNVFRMETNIDDGSVSIIDLWRNPEPVTSGIESYVYLYNSAWVGEPVYGLCRAFPILATEKRKADRTERFAKNQITPGLAEIINAKTTNGKSLTGVYFGGQNLEGIGFSNSDVSYADFSHATLYDTAFYDITANHTIFDNAILTNWDSSTRLDNCSFIKTTIDGGSVLNVVLANCTFDTVNFGKDPQSGKQIILRGADFTGSTFINCNFDNADLEGVIFNGADLTKADFSKALPGGKIKDLRFATLTRADFSGMDLSTCLINTYSNDAPANFKEAVLVGTNFTGNDLSNAIFVNAKMMNAKLDRTTLDGVQMAFAHLDFASVTGGVSMIGADLGNANLQFAKFHGAQLGAEKTALNLPLTHSTFLDDKKIPSDLPVGLKVSAQASVTIVQPGLSWEITDGQKTYPVKKTATNLLVEISTAAVLTNAYMENANFEQANMYAVEMSGVYWFGSDAKADGAVLSEANLSNSYLINMQIKGAKMQGASLDNARLIGTVFDGAVLSPDTNLKPTSFASASLQGATFTGTNLFYANLTDAAFALEKGVPLFHIESSEGFTLDSIIKSLNTKSLSNNLKTAFKNNAYPIIDSAVINDNTVGTSWTINNTDSNNSAQVGYGNFNLELIERANASIFIQVYGASPLLVLKANGKGGQDQDKLEFAPTGVTKDQMNGDTTCPSGMKFSYLNDHISFEEIMTAQLPPQPPPCSNCWGKGL